MTDGPQPPFKPKAWARVFPALRRSFSKSLRRGAWYPVIDNELPDRVTIIMDGEPVDAPRRILEVRSRRPVNFSVVTRTDYEPKPKRQSQYNLGKRYAVCPRCAHRFALWGRPNQRVCPRCGHDGEVAWWEE
jgi:hypothetical protein